MYLQIIIVWYLSFYCPLLITYSSIQQSIHKTCFYMYVQQSLNNNVFAKTRHQRQEACTLCRCCCYHFFCNQVCIIIASSGPLNIWGTTNSTTQYHRSPCKMYGAPERQAFRMSQVAMQEQPAYSGSSSVRPPVAVEGIAERWGAPWRRMEGRERRTRRRRPR